MIKKFHASSTREALRQIRDSLGADAIILSNRQVAGGVEIMAVADMDMAALGVPQLPESYLAEKQAAPFRTAGNRQVQHEIFAKPVQPVDAPVTAPLPAVDTTQETSQEIMKEIRFLRGMLEGQLAGLAWSDMQRREPAKKYCGRC